MKHPARIDTPCPGSSRPGRLATAWLVALLIAGCGGGGSDSGSSSGDASGGIVTVVPPAAVTDVVATASDDTVVLTFAVPEPQNVTGFKATCVAQTPTSAGIAQTVTATATANGTASGEVRIGGLTDAQAQHYSCSVIALNGDSVSSTATTPVAATSSGSSNTPDKPRDTTVTAGPTSAVIDFSEATVNGGTAVSAYVGVCVGSDLTAYSYAVESPVVVEGLTPGVDYACSVSGINADGQGTASASITVRPLADAPASADAPTAPSNVVATPGAGSASIAFASALAGGSDTAVIYRATCSTTGSAISAESPASPITVPRLTNGSSYSCVVTATTDAGTSGKSSPASVVPFTVPGAPTLTDVVSGDRFATLSFSAPAFDGGSAILGYHATCAIEGQTGGTGVVSTASADTTSAGAVTVAGLTNGSTYLCSIVARNASERSSDASESRRASPSRPDDVPAPDASQLPAAPTSLLAIAGNGSATFSFTPVTGGTVTVLDYTVTCSAGNETVPGTGKNSPIVVSPLRSSVEYTCSVAARAQAGSGEASTAVTITLAAAVPKAPILVDATPGNRTITLRFTAAPDDASSIAGYTAACGVGTTPVSAGSSPIAVSGLVNGQTYSCSVYATNQAGVNGGVSNSKPAKPRTVPQKPTEVSASAGVSTITLAYTSPSDNGGADIIDFIGLCQSGTNVYTPEPVASTATSITVSVRTIPDGSTYDCTVAARNAAGTGAPSDTVHATPTIAATETAPDAATHLQMFVGDSTLTVSFDRPDSNGADVSYALICSPGEIKKTAMNGSATATNLTNGTSYSCLVRATRGSKFTDAALPSPGIPNAKPAKPTLSVTAGDGQLNYGFTRVSGVTYTASCRSGVIGEDSFSVTGLTNGTSYACVLTATNSAGSAESDSVSGTPVSRAAPVLAATVGDRMLTFSFTRDAGRTYTATCSAGTLGEISAQGVFTLSGLTNGTSYSCTVTGKDDSGFKVTSAEVAATPNVFPTARVLTLAGVTDSTLTFSFKPVAGETYGAACSGGSVTIVNRLTQRDLTVSGLSTGKSYSCTVTGSNSAGSVTSAPASGTTASAVAPSLAVTVGDRMLTYSFTPDAGRTYTASCSGGAVGAISAQGVFTLSGLTNGTSYWCTVAGKDSSGVSRVSAQLSATPNALPTARTLTLASVGDKALSYTFSTVSGETYAASCTKADTTTPAGTAAISGGTVSVTGLSNGTAYSCTVTSSNSAGPATSAPVLGTPNVPPSARTLTLASVGDKRLNYTFSPVSGEMYTAACTVASTTTAYGTATVSGGTVSVTGLNNDITYSCAITSSNSAGSVSSASVNGKPTATLTARTLTLSLAGDTTLLYTFVANPGEVYTASCVVAANSQPAGTVTVGEGNFLVQGLTNGTTYSCAVKSTNSANSVLSLGVTGTPIAVPTARTLTLQSVGNGTLSYTFDPITGETYAASCIDVSTSASAGTAIVSNGTVSVTDLSNGTTYGCKIKSANSAGSATSASVSGTPRNITVSSAPTNVSLTSSCVKDVDNPTSTTGIPRLTVAYGLPSSDGGSAVTSFTAVLHKINGTSDFTQTSSTGSAGSMYWDGGLATKVYVTVTARNDAGPSPAVNTNWMESGFCGPDSVPK